MRTNDHATKTASLPRIRGIRKNFMVRSIHRTGIPKIQCLFVITILSVILLSGLILLTAGYTFNEVYNIVPETQAIGQYISESDHAAEQGTYDHKSSKETEIPGTFKSLSPTDCSASKQINDSSDVLSAHIPSEGAISAGDSSEAVSPADNTAAYSSSAVTASGAAGTESTAASATAATESSTASAAAGTESSTASANASQPDASEAGERLVVPFFYVGDQFGTLSITSVDIYVNIYQGDSEDEFQLGAGHYCGSLFPGQGGNIVIASHCTTYFRNFEYLKIGDEVKIETVYGRFTYQIQEIKILESNFDSIVDETDQERITMYTCYPFTSGVERTSRYVVIGNLVESELT